MMCAQTGQGAGRDLLPRPQEIEETEGGFVLSADTKVFFANSGLPESRFAAERLAGLIREEFSLSLRVEPADMACSHVLVLAESAQPVQASGRELTGLGEEAYTVTVSPNGAVLCGATGRGLLWAAMTFRQLLERRAGGVSAPGVRIRDWPRYPWRGFMIDSGRGPNGLPKIKRIVRIASAFKLNFLIFREGDDELSSVRYRTNKLGRGNPYALSMSEVGQFIEYADRHGVTVIPEIESLGHSRAKGFDYPELIEGGYLHPYEGLGGRLRKPHLIPGDKRALSLLESMYEEWISVLKGSFLHIGMDEVRLDSDVQANHLMKVLDLLRHVAGKHRKNIVPMIWSDAPRLPESYEEQVIRCLWAYEDNDRQFGPVGVGNPFLLRQGIDRLAQPGCKQKAFLAGGSGSNHTPYSKGEYKDAFENLWSWAELGQDHENWIGLLAVQWSGNMLDLWLPDFLAAAACGWNPQQDRMGFPKQMEVIRRHLSGLRDAAAPQPDELDPPVWDGILLKDNRWHQDIMTGKVADNANTVQPTDREQ